MILKSIDLMSGAANIIGRKLGKATTLVAIGASSVLALQIAAINDCFDSYDYEHYSHQQLNTDAQSLRYKTVLDNNGSPHTFYDTQGNITIHMPDHYRFVRISEEAFDKLYGLNGLLDKKVGAFSADKMDSILFTAVSKGLNVEREWLVQNVYKTVLKHEEVHGDAFSYSIENYRVNNNEAELDYTTGHAMHEFIADLNGLKAALYDLAESNEPDLKSKSIALVTFMAAFRLKTNAADCHAGGLLALTDLLDEVHSDKFNRDFILGNYTLDKNNAAMKHYVDGWRDTDLSQKNAAYSPDTVKGEFEQKFIKDVQVATDDFTKTVALSTPWLAGEVASAIHNIDNPDKGILATVSSYREQSEQKDHLNKTIKL